MKRLLITVPVLLTLVQIPSMARQPQSPAKSSLEGVVVRAGTGEPLAGARVTLSLSMTASVPTAGVGALVTSVGAMPASSPMVAVSPAPATALPEIPPVMTDLDGKFVFQNLDAGLYRLQVLRNGYARRSYGQRTAGGPATAIRLAAGQSIKDIVMALVPAGNGSGVIRDPGGQPQSGVPVQLLRAIFNSAGERTFEVAATDKTDDRGEYRLYWITPGRYYLSGGAAPGPN